QTKNYPAFFHCVTLQKIKSHDVPEFIRERPSWHVSPIFLRLRPLVRIRNLALQKLQIGMERYS
ncbi:MAG: hypothetical protein JW836_13740, partial [Deltaproteobacteria bacterium]|nr:hypothetical protein [Deltaproteobacteria bacterium]